MKDKMIMEFKITIDRSNLPMLTASNGMAKIIPFGGTVESELFTGKVMPGAADVQITDAAGVRHMCARYMFEGYDYTGAACHLFVDNNGYFERGHNPKPFEAHPVFMTDSKVLEEYLHGDYFRAEGYSNEKGVDIRIFDIRQEKMKN